jgi:hypothetical protein
VGPDQKQTDARNITLETMKATDPWMLFLYALKAPATRDKYIEVNQIPRFSGYKGTKEEKALVLRESLLSFFSSFYFYSAVSNRSEIMLD